MWHAILTLEHDGWNPIDFSLSTHNYNVFRLTRYQLSAHKVQTRVGAHAFYEFFVLITNVEGKPAYFSPLAFLTMGICQLEAVKGEFKGGNRPLGTDGL